MLFVILSKNRSKVSKENIERTTKILANEPKVKALGFYYTFGRYDTVLIAEAPDEKTMLKLLLEVGDFAATETMLAVSREEAIKLLK
jgi:uncharacterized protein with GYD domain